MEMLFIKIIKSIVGIFLKLIVI